MFKLSIIASLLLSSAAFAAVEKGEWTLAPSGTPGKVHFSLHSGNGGRHSFNSSSDWEISELKGLDSSPAKHDVRFTINRDAGTIDAEGFMKEGSGAGLFTFKGSPQYSQQMSSLGFPGVTDEDLFAYTIHNVSLDFVRAIKAEQIGGLSKDKLIAFRIHGVSPDFIREIHAAGIKTSDPDKLIAFRIHGVSPEFVKNLSKAGIGTTDEDKLIAFRIHGVSPEYVGQLDRLGFKNPEADKLIALRIHGVTPEYIEKLRARGMQNLTLDQLIKLRIHGIN